MENKNIQKTTAEESSDIFAVAEDQDKKNAAIDYAAFVMQLARPLVHDEKTYTELTFNFEDLSGNDSLAIERELQMLGHTVIVANFDSEYLIRVCVKACTEKLGLDALGKLSIRDFNRLRNTVRGFYRARSDRRRWRRMASQAMPRHGPDEQHSGRFLVISTSRRIFAMGESL